MKLLRLLALLVAFAGFPAFAMQQYANVVQDRNGNIIASATVTVYDYPAGTTSTVYATNAVGANVNPLTTDSSGNFNFYAADGQYTIVVTKTGISAQTYGPVSLYQPLFSRNDKWQTTSDGVSLQMTFDASHLSQFSPRTNGFQLAQLGGAMELSLAQITAPTCTTNCGTSPTVTGSDSAGVVTMGASGSPASGWVVTFNGTWPAAPTCTVQMAKTGMVIGKLPLTVVTTTTTLTVVTNGTAPSNSDVYFYQCLGVS